MAAVLRLVPGGAGDIHAVAPSLDDEIRLAGQRMESAMAAGQRERAVAWMQCMYALIRVRGGGEPAADIRTGALRD